MLRRWMMIGMLCAALLVTGCSGPTLPATGGGPGAAGRSDAAGPASSAIRAEVRPGPTAGLVTGVRPATARDLLLARPDVAAWYAAHSAPAVLAGLSPTEAKRWRKYHPAVMVDLVKEGLQVRLEAQFGPAPRKLDALMDRETGAVLSVRER